MKAALPIGWCIAAIALLSGCRPEYPEYIDEYDLVLTSYSPSYDFAAKRTYAMPDSVVKITGAVTQGDQPEMVDPVYADPILNDLRRNMNDRGWTEVTENEGPDVVLIASVITTTNVDVYYYDWWYWSWYYPWAGGWYYPGYYPAYVTGYTTGTVMVQMIDPHDPAVTGNTAVVWTAALNGVAEGSSSGLVDRINTGIDQAFVQSTYLKH